MIVSLNEHFANRFPDREDRNPFVCGIAAGLPIQPAQPVFAPFVVQGDDRPTLRVEHRASGTPGLGRRPVMDARNAWKLRHSAWGPFMIEKLVVLKRESEVLSAGMTDNVD